MRIAIIGAGVSGLCCAHRLHASHEIAVFEAADYPGGHTNTIDVIDEQGRAHAVDTGFIVYNEANYPNFAALLDELNVESQPTSMSFSVRDDGAGLEYGGQSLAGLFAQRRNLFNPGFVRMLRDIRRFGPRVRAAANNGFANATLGAYLDREDWSAQFIDGYLLPLAGAIWSAPPLRMRDFPLAPFVRFFDNHGMLEPWKAPRWRTVAGGSRTYVERLIAPFRDRIRLNAPVARVERDELGVTVKPFNEPAERFDEVILAVHSDQALRLLADPSPAERGILGAIPYQPNEAILHTDPTILPRRRAAWSSWNYRAPQDREGVVGVTYHMNLLQSLDTSTPFNVTLNDTERIDPAKIIRRFVYDHPVYSVEGFDAQRRLSEISGVNRTNFCGAWCGYGFHEDGVRSAYAVCRRFEEALV